MRFRVTWLSKSQNEGRPPVWSLTLTPEDEDATGNPNALNFSFQGEAPPHAIELGSWFELSLEPKR
jgi:hypothetical protein